MPPGCARGATWGGAFTQSTREHFGAESGDGALCLLARGFDLILQGVAFSQTPCVGLGPAPPMESTPRAGGTCGEPCTMHLVGGGGLEREDLDFRPGPGWLQSSAASCPTWHMPTLPNSAFCGVGCVAGLVLLGAWVWCAQRLHRGLALLATRHMRQLHLAWRRPKLGGVVLTAGAAPNWRVVSCRVFAAAQPPRC